MQQHDAEAHLEITFVENTAEALYQTRVFRRKPLGIEFRRKMPMTLTRTRGEAADLGVLRGWKILAFVLYKQGQVSESVNFEGRTFDDAYKILINATSSLSKDWLVRNCPTDMAFGDLASHVGPLAPDDVAPYLQRFGYSVFNAESWAQNARVSLGDEDADECMVKPHLNLGVIDGHAEKQNSVGHAEVHTWYSMQCRIALRGSSSSFRWKVERRLIHLRRLLHDPVKAQLGKKYDALFRDAHFAKRGGLPGTTKRLMVWLSALAQAINDQSVSPSLVALTLRFLEAPELISDGKDDPVANANAVSEPKELDVSAVTDTCAREGTDVRDPDENTDDEGGQDMDEVCDVVTEGYAKAAALAAQSEHLNQSA